MDTSSTDPVRVIQVSAAAGEGEVVVVALDSRGQIWFNAMATGGQWAKAPRIPLESE